ncbi:hypothetical protein GLOIN_2v1845959 [Rhizophagus irregularis DAOM 181602=DAOM 197198]|nr:hypothetical protein GLOIN_2v1845959 [Rhizophagus irregularis DAOM 181602=DAOM 197198]
MNYFFYLLVELPLISNATDVGILHIEAMKRFTRNLHILSLSKTRIKNESLRIIGNSAFSHIRSLKYLKVGYNCVTDKGVKELEAEMSQLLIGIIKEFCNDDDDESSKNQNIIITKYYDGLFNYIRIYCY